MLGLEGWVRFGRSRCRCRRRCRPKGSHQRFVLLGLLLTLVRHRNWVHKRRLVDLPYRGCDRIHAGPLLALRRGSNGCLSADTGLGWEGLVKMRRRLLKHFPRMRLRQSNSGLLKKIRITFGSLRDSDHRIDH
jgi:hypothetical protein